MIMKINASRRQNDSVPQPKQHRGPFKGLLSRGKSTDTNNQNHQRQQRPVDDLEITHSPRRRNNDFLPNPKIPNSPSRGTPPSKTWEGAYMNYLSKGSHAPALGGPPETLPDVRKAGFSIMPGTKRLLVRAQPGQEIPVEGIPALPSIKGNATGFSLRPSHRAQSMTEFTPHHSPSRQGGVLRSVFARSTSDVSVSLQRRTRKTSSDSDELDSAMRRGVSKGSTEGTSWEEKCSYPAHARTVSHEDIPSGLDALLSEGSCSPHLSVELASFPRSGSSYAMMFPLTSTPESEQMSHNGSIQQRASSSSYHYQQTGLPLDDDSSPHSSHCSGSFPFAQRPQHEAVPAKGGLGSLLAEHGVHHPSHVSVPPPTLPNTQKPGDIPRNTSLSNGVAVATSDSTDNLTAMLRDASFAANSSPSSAYHQSSLTPPDQELKKAFTNFHNQARFARDSTSAFLGGDGLNSSPHNSFVTYHMAMMGHGSTAVPRQASSERHLPTLAYQVPPVPEATVDENNISIQIDMRLLKRVQGTEAWEAGRRYLIAPAALSACPVQVVNRLASGTILTPGDAASSSDLFAAISFGQCLMTYVGEKHHLSLGKWSSCQLVLRQNYLMEFSSDVSLSGLPRGFINLQHAKAYPNMDFPDALELDFYASPCAKEDRRHLMIRVNNRADRDHCVKCLNHASSLRISDLWEFDEGVEYGRGRYAAVFPARRKTTKSTTEAGTNDQDTLEDLECTLKIIDKNEFWRRVVKGRERADTLVREVSVQSTLTCKCPTVPSFLRLRGYFETSDNVVMELELLEGTDLFRYISSKGVLSEKEAASILKDMLMSLDAMNRVGLVHRDIKPANVLMCDSANDGACVKIGDFGMSSFVGVDGLVRGRCGTPGYVAPEILTADSRAGYTSKVDVFSAGVTLYVMLCGYEPFYGENEKDLIEANKRAVIEFNSSDWSSISMEARDIIQKLTAVDPSERIAAKDALEHPWISSLCN